MLIFSIIAVLSIPVMAQEITRVSIAWESGLKPPYIMLDENSQPYGIAVDILKEIFTRQKIVVKHIILPWKRCLLSLEKQKVDIVPNSTYKMERAVFAYYSKPIYETHLGYLYKINHFKTKPVISRMEDLESYIIGGMLGFNYSWYSDKVSIQTGTSTRKMLINKLRRERIDFAILQKEVLMALHHEGKLDLTGLGMIPEPFRPSNIFYVLTVKTSKGKTLKKIINAGIDQLNQDGTLLKIRKLYMGEEF